ncbi:MAG: DUF192 domain-containing protein [Candidatus Magasanikbacteria bacterium]
MIFKRENKEPKRWHFVVLIVVIALGLGLKLYSYHFETVKVRLNNQEYKVLVARTLTQQYRGWGERKNMGAAQGMLFFFNNRDQHTMVMRDMLFPIDIVWVDGQIVVDMAPNVSIEPGKTENQLTPYIGRGVSTIVLEMASGTIANAGLKIGDVVEIIDN